MDYKINFDESIPVMIERLKKEHVHFKRTLNKITKCNDENYISEAIITINDIRESIIKNAVEEEARIMRVIMHNAKEESTDSIKIMQEHNLVADFLKHKIPNMEDNIYQRLDNQDKHYQQSSEGN